MIQDPRSAEHPRVVAARGNTLPGIEGYYRSCLIAERNGPTLPGRPGDGLRLQRVLWPRLST